VELGVNNVSLAECHEILIIFTSGWRAKRRPSNRCYQTNGKVLNLPSGNTELGSPHSRDISCLDSEFRGFPLVPARKWRYGISNHTKTVYSHNDFNSPIRQSIKQTIN